MKTQSIGDKCYVLLSGIKTSIATLKESTEPNQRLFLLIISSPVSAEAVPLYIQ